MSIWASWPLIGIDEDDHPDPARPVLTYWEGHGNHYPEVGVESSGAVGIDSIPAHCTPGAHEDAEGTDPSWVRLTLLTTNSRCRPMIGLGGTVLLSRAAVASLHNQLSRWLAVTDE